MEREQPDFYCHSLSVRDLSLPPHSISTPRNCTTLATLLFDFACLRKPSHIILRPCSFPATRRMRIYLPIFEIPGPQQKAGAAHELKPLSIPPVASGNLRDPVFVPGSLGLTHNTPAIPYAERVHNTGKSLGSPTLNPDFGFMFPTFRLCL